MVAQISTKRFHSELNLRLGDLLEFYPHDPGMKTEGIGLAADKSGGNPQALGHSSREVRLVSAHSTVTPDILQRVNLPGKMRRVPVEKLVIVRDFLVASADHHALGLIIALAPFPLIKGRAVVDQQHQELPGQ